MRQRIARMIVLAALLPMMAWAGNVKSPNGNIELKFSVDNTGRPVYEMTYKGKAVIKPRLCNRQGRDLRVRRDLATRLGRDQGHPKPLQRTGRHPSEDLERAQDYQEHGRATGTPTTSP